MIPSLKDALDDLSRIHQRNIDSDPIHFSHQFQDPKDREVVAFISAMYAFGNVKAIFGTLRNIFSFLGTHPNQKLRMMRDHDLKKHRFAKHRWITTSDTKFFLKLIQKILREHQSLENSFLTFKTADMGKALIDWFDFLKLELVSIQRKPLTRGQKFMFASPSGKSASKRLMMFMRWMVRKEYPDLGLWKSISASELFMPLDVHLFQFSQQLGFTKRKQANWSTVVEVTGQFKKLNPQDPILYDFALARLGILNLCIHKIDTVRCNPCPIKKHCLLHK